MIKKEVEKKEAIRLRKQGLTYAEILSQIPVAKSTLALWLHSVKLARRQRHILTIKKREAGLRGSQARHRDRVGRFDAIVSQARAEVSDLSRRELFLIGIVLYWGEGAKEKSYRPGSGIDFINMDPRMIVIFLRWLTDICNTPNDMIVFELSLHETSIMRVTEIQRYWAGVTGFPLERFKTVRLKKNMLSPTKRKNVGETYHGCLKIRVRQSSTLVRKIAGWTDGIVNSVIEK